MLPYRIAPLLFFNRSKALWSAIKGKVFHFIYLFIFTNWVIVLYFWSSFVFIRAHFMHPIHAEMLEQATEEHHRKVLWANIG